MAVYVDDMEAPFGRMIMCHMIADTHIELLQMADRIQVQRKWIQSIGTAGEHFDLSKDRRRLAVAFGAVEIDMRALSEKCHTRRTDAAREAYYAGTTAPQGLPGV